MGHSRFTLVEMMITVGIISLLAAIAVPAVTTMQLKAKRAEASLSYDGITTAIVAFNNSEESDAQTGNASNSYQPDGLLPGKKAVPWTPNDPEPLQRLAWRPDGDVRCRYGASGGVGGQWAVHVICNVDGNTRIYSVQGAMADGIKPTYSVGDLWYFEVGCTGATLQRWWGVFAWQHHDSPCY